MKVLSDKKPVVKEEMIEKTDDKDDYKEAGGHESDEDYLQSEDEPQKEKDYIPLDYKIKVVNLAKEHPKWRLKTLQRHGCSRLKRLDELSRWKKDIENGGSIIDKYNTIDSLTFDRFLEARKRSQLVTTENLQQWALAAAKQYPNLEFKATESWVKRFKNKHCIRQQKITKFVSEDEKVTTDGTAATRSRTFSNRTEL